MSFEKPNLFVASCAFSEKEIVKRAGFDWDPDERHWFTMQIEKAARLREYFDKRLKNLFDKVSIKPTPWAGRLLTPAKLHSWQERGVKFAMTRNHSYLAFDMGLGKTAIGVTLFNIAVGEYALKVHDLRDQETELNLLIVPPFLITNWIREIGQWSFPNQIRYQVVDKGGPISIGENTNLLIVPDSLFPNAETRESLLAMKFGQCVIDEAQRFLVSESERTKFLYGDSRALAGGLVHRCRRVTLLSGTPMKRGPIELWPVLRALAWNRLKFMTMLEYGKKFCDGRLVRTYGSNMAWNFKGESNIDVLANATRHFFLREELEDNIEDLKGKLIEEVVTLDGMKTKKVEKLESILFERDKRLSSYMGGNSSMGEISEYRKELSKSKLTPGLAFIKNILDGGDESVLVLAHHIELVEALESGLKKYKPLVIYGKTSKPERDRIEKDFQNNRSRILVANISTMVGLNLTKATRVVFVESSWSSTDNDQARSRAYRLGQTKRVIVSHLVLANTLDEYVLNAIVKKKTTINKMF